MALISNVANTYEYNNNKESLFHQKKQPYHYQYLAKYELNFSNSGTYIQFLLDIYENINNVLSTYLISTLPEISFNIIMNVITNLNDIREERASFVSICDKFAELALLLLIEGKLDNDKKLNSFILFVSTLCSISIMSPENYTKITGSLNSFATTLVKRSDQCIAMLNCSNLYFHDSMQQDSDKCYKCLSKASEFADYALTTNTQNLNLLVLLINKYYYYVEKGADFVKAKNINKLVNKIENLIHSIKTEGTNISFLDNIERYYNATLEILKSRKKTSTNKLYEELLD